VGGVVDFPWLAHNLTAVRKLTVTIVPANLRATHQFTPMRFIAYLMLLYSLFSFGTGIRDQSRGLTMGTGIRDQSRGLTMDRKGAAEDPVSKRTEEELFWGLISYRYSLGAVFLIGGFVVLGIAKRHDASDPIAPDFTANVKEEPVDPMLEEELRKRRGGLR
jgi:hypothetical protein